MKNYILIPSDMRNQDEVLDLLMSEGPSGYGVFIMVCEFLRECEGYKTRNDAKRLSFALRIGDATLVDRVLHNYGLFEASEDGNIECPIFTASMAGYDRKREANKAAAAARWAKREQQNESNANAMHMHESGSNAAKHTQSENAPNSIVLNSSKGVHTPNSTESACDFGGVVRVERSLLKNIERQPCTGASREVLESLYTRANGRWLHDVSSFFKLNDIQTQLLWEISGKGNMKLQNTKDILASLACARSMKDPIKYPMSYILSKIQSYEK